MRRWWWPIWQRCAPTYDRAATIVTGTSPDPSFDTAVLRSVHGAVYGVPIVDGKFEIKADLFGGDELMLYLQRGSKSAAFVETLRIVPGVVMLGDSLK